MKANVVRACGHTEAVAIYGPYRQRAAALAREQGKVCAACYAAQKAAQREAAAAAAAQAAQAAGLPALNGTPKQIAWAEQIRSTALAAVEELLAQQGEDRRQDPRWAKIEAAVAALRHQAQAAWWIDRRAHGQDARGWIREVYAA